jgi:uncharacterized protein
MSAGDGGATNATALDQLAKSSNVSLTTYRRDGTPIATPVGGVVSDGTLYILSYADTGKLKRLRRDPRVIVAPCNSAGTVAPGAPRLEGTGRLLDPEGTRKAYRLMARKTFLARAARAFYLVRGKRDPWVGIEVTF